MTRAGRTLLLGAVIALLGLPHPATAALFNVGGPPRNDIDGDAGAGTAVSVNSYAGGIIERDSDELGIQVTITTSAGYSDNLQIFLEHDGISVEIYRGEGDTEDAQINATFSMNAEDPAPTTGSVSISALPVGDLDAFRGRDLSGIWTLRFVDPAGVFNETDLDFWALTGNTEPSTPGRSVALFYNSFYVDTVDNVNDGIAQAEALNLRELLVSLGHDVETFTGIAAADWAAALAGKDALVIPTIEGFDLQGQPLHPDLSAAARDVIRNFVAGGGIFITTSSFWSNNGELVNALFGFGAESGGAATGTILDATIGSPFQTTAGILQQIGAVNRGLQSLPPEAVQYHQGEFFNNLQFFPADTVVSVPYPVDGSGGKITWLAYTFLDARPQGNSDGGWVDALNRAVLDDLAPFFTQQTVAFFDDPDYVDTADDAANLKASLLTLGHDVRPFTGTSLAAVSAALADADVLVFPDLEVADPQPDLDASGAEMAIFDWVSAGGVLILSAASAENLLESLLARDPLYQTEANTIDLCTAPPDPTICDEPPDPPPPGCDCPDATPALAFAFPVAGTAFQSPGASLPNDGSLPPNDNTDVFRGIPVGRGASRVYQVGSDDAALGYFGVGAGNISWLGWDWEDGTQDNGWVDALSRAVSAAGPLPVPEPSALPAAGAVCATLIALGRARRAKANPGNRATRG